MVIISNGFSKFHLSVAAAEAERRQALSCFLTGAYPTPLVRKILSFPYLRTSRKAQRLGARRDQIDDKFIRAHFSSEALYDLGKLRNSETMVIDSLRFYGWSTIRHVERAAAKGARIYHYRAGFGGKSVEVARRLGLFTLCDHSIAHPLTVDSLVNNNGRMPTSPEILSASPLWKYVLYDIEMADAVLVNSRFVKDTFQSVSHNHSSVHVIYLGVDDSFLALVPKREKTENEFHMLFAGVFEKRKGAETLIDGLERLDGIPWQLEIAGPLDRGIVNRNPGFFSNQRVKCLGLLSRQDLAQAMSRADVFVFPSLAEGSARVVFEALACGCYVITTPNSGSIVEDGMHGGLVPPGDSVSLAAAIEFAYQHRDGVSDIGRSNALCVTAKYRQSDYGDQLSDLYRQLLGES